MPRWARELTAAVVALGVSLVVVSLVAGSARAELLFRDGDSLLTALVARSVAVGQPQDWAMSTVLFLPELAVFGILSLLGTGVAGTLALNGVLNLLALYGAFRVVSGSHARARAPIAGALAAFGAFALLAVLESSPSRDALELASLVATTTYYSATVIAAVASVGLVRRVLDDDARRSWPLWGVAGVAAASVLSNPLFAAWAGVPLVGVLGVIGLRRREPRAGWAIVALAAGCAAGFLGRIPLAPLIANTGAGYADPARWAESLAYYGQLAAERWGSSGGPAATALTLGLLSLGVACTVVLARRRAAAGVLVVAAVSWAMPLLVVGGAIALGTHAARYVQPLAFGTVLALAVLPELLPQPAGRAVRAAPLVAGIASALVVVGALASVPRLAHAVSHPDPDLACVVDWVDASGRTGAGQFWTVRLPKARVSDPRTLVQVDHRLDGYAWLVDRDDFSVGRVTFLVLDAQSPAFDLPGATTLDDADLVSCGRYTIADFGEPGLPLGPQRS
ncbi:hypothetical protein HLA99_13810 [Microbacterium ulmi]|uniref:4-amino-4-deoxy-L-arabinose transferase n=2 Tax=Microbacterium ulmi TaxID=179095 RepID=A0A7Y2M2Q5_9MICO|nr:hypothetical protein [Microbacterium ulmi]NNH04924.1 hypothetical protein [Microbacterium ulmi]